MGVFTILGAVGGAFCGAGALKGQRTNCTGFWLSKQKIGPDIKRSYDILRLFPACFKNSFFRKEGNLERIRERDNWRYKKASRKISSPVFFMEERESLRKNESLGEKRGRDKRGQ